VVREAGGMSDARDQQEEHPVDEDDVAERAALLPEERAAGSDDPRAQAEAILEESAARTEHPDTESSSQSPRRSSDESV
jgi:hypothetical protein